MQQEILSIQSVSKTFKLKNRKNTVNALDDVSISIKRGEIFGLLGPNGAGKSTLIKIITGLVFADKGKVLLEGIDIVQNREKFLSQVGAQIEEPAFFLKRSGAWNLKYLADMQGGLSDERINDIVSVVGLSDRINSNVATYSMGMKQRLGIAQAIMHNPKLLILDEPINGLDPDGIAELRELIKTLSRKYLTTIILSSHILGEMQQLCDRVGFLSKGKLIAVKTMQEIQDGLDKVKIISVSCDEPNRAGEIIKEKFGYRTTVKNGLLYVEFKGENIGDLNTELVKSGINISGLSEKKRSLEEIYKELTK